MGATAFEVRDRTKAGEQEYDALGNLMDHDVQYARGKILATNDDEAIRQQHGFDLMEGWIKQRGISEIYNLNGVVRAQPLTAEDLPNLGFFESIMNLRGKAEEAAIHFLGGDPQKHSGLVTNRVTASSIAALLSMIRKGDTVLCVSLDGRSHPSVKLGIALAGGNFVECTGFEGYRDVAEEMKDVSTVAITTITPQYRHLPFEQVRQIMNHAKDNGLNTFVDDAHGALRMVAYDEPGMLKAEPDVVALCADKHIYGPRSGVTAGKKQLMKRVQTIALDLGLEAQTPILAGTYRALKNHKNEHIQRALEVAGKLNALVQTEYPKRFYFENDCVAMTDANIIRLIEERANQKIGLVPQEACSALSMLMLERFGVLTVSAMASPGAAPYLRFIAWPDGHRVGPKRILEAFNYAVTALTKVVEDEAAVRKIVLGSNLS